LGLGRNYDYSNKPPRFTIERNHRQTGDKPTRCEELVALAGDEPLTWPIRLDIEHEQTIIFADEHRGFASTVPEAAEPITIGSMRASVGSTEDWKGLQEPIRHSLGARRLTCLRLSPTLRQ